MMLGLAARMSSTSMPSFWRTGARLLVMKTSAAATTRASTRRPSSEVRSAVKLRLPRLGTSRKGLGPSSARLSRLRRARCGSPLGASTLITSAPRSANAAPAAGTNVQFATSTTRTPSSGPDMLASPLGLRPNDRPRINSRERPLPAKTTAGISAGPGRGLALGPQRAQLTIELLRALQRKEELGPGQLDGANRPRNGRGQPSSPGHIEELVGRAPHDQRRRPELGQVVTDGHRDGVVHPRHVLLDGLG